MKLFILYFLCLFFRIRCLSRQLWISSQWPNHTGKPERPQTPSLSIGNPFKKIPGIWLHLWMKIIFHVGLLLSTHRVMPGSGKIHPHMIYYRLRGRLSCLLFCVFCLFFGYPVAHGVLSQIQATVAHICHSFGNARSLTHCAGPRTELASQCSRDATDPIALQQEIWDRLSFLSEFLDGSAIRILKTPLIFYAGVLSKKTYFAKGLFSVESTFGLNLKISIKSQGDTEGTWLIL